MLFAFDLDGTLFSSEPILFDAYQEAVTWSQEQGWGPARCPKREEIFLQVGQPVPVIFAKLFPELPEKHHKKLSVRILDGLCEKIKTQNAGFLFPKVLETLKKMRERGDRVCIISNARRAYLDAVIQAHGLLPGPIEKTWCHGDMPDKNKGDMLKIAMDFFNIKKEETWMIGDRDSDLNGAIGAACHFIGAGWGGANRNIFPDPKIKILSHHEMLLNFGSSAKFMGK